MMMKSKLMVMVLLIATSAAGAPLSVEQSHLFETIAGVEPVVRASAENDFRWNGRIEAGRTVEIKGINGSIHAEPSSGSEVEVVASKESRRSNIQDVQIKVVQHEGGVTICAVYPTPEGRSANDCTPGRNWSANTRNNDVQIDFKVRVPQGINFSGRTVNGEVETGLIGGNVEAFTVNGSVRVAATGYAEAHTVNGSINASLGSANWNGELDFRTVNGEITLDLPADLSAQVSAETLNGDISTDFPMTVQGRVSRRRLNATIGAGGRELNLKTINGGINLRRAS
jgi:Uncharacterized conserved protein